MLISLPLINKLRAYAVTIALGLLVLAVAAGLAWTYRTGFASGAASVQSKWDKSIKDANAQREREALEARALATEYDTRITALEARYERTSQKLLSAVGARFTCPTSGVIGDVVVPADLVDSMFNRDGIPSSVAAPVQPYAAVR